MSSEQASRLSQLPSACPAARSLPAQRRGSPQPQPQPCTSEGGTELPARAGSILAATEGSARAAAGAPAYKHSFALAPTNAACCRLCMLMGDFRRSRFRLKRGFHMRTLDAS